MYLPEVTTSDFGEFLGEVIRLLKEAINMFPASTCIGDIIWLESSDRPEPLVRGGYHQGTLAKMSYG